MLATFVIGLREGLEAALIVGIIAAFLRRNDRSLRTMWIGVGLAVAASIAVGATLGLIEQSLPQAAQEGMESIIGVVAVVFVTGMIAWMNTNARHMREQLEDEAATALRDGHALGLAVMAFLAVLKEGFETSVFLLATFTASADTTLAAVGAVLGILAAIAVGVGIYYGGVKLNLARFFRITGVFLILVAAGLVMTTLRTAHEAGWIVAGQQQVADLSWLVRPGTVPAALLTGVLGIPADPRLIEVVGWFAYLVPVALYVYWPSRRRPRGRAVPALQASLATALAVATAALAIGFAAVPAPGPGAATLVDANGSAVGTASLDGDALVVHLDGHDPETTTLDPAQATGDTHAGLAARTWQWTTDAAPGSASLTLDALATLGGGSLPIGINRAAPGPFDARWSVTVTRTVWVLGTQLLDVAETRRAVVTLSGGGLSTPRTVTLPSADPADGGWSTADLDDRAAALGQAAAFSDERMLWGVQVPTVLLTAAVVLCVMAVRSGRRLRSQSATPLPPPPESVSAPQRRDTHALP